MSAENRKIILGTRGSDLARTQAQLVERAILAVRPDTEIDTKVIVTHGDRGSSLANSSGRKGLFTAEIERALLAREIDIAIHSAKDLPSEMTSETEIAAVLPRASVNDVLVSKQLGGLASLPPGAAIATGSVRRRRQLLWKREDLKIVELRGNVPTRIRKLAEKNWDAIVLAHAGLERLGGSASSGQIGAHGSHFFVEVLPIDVFLPAGGQGIIAIQVRANDQSMKAIAGPANSWETLLCLRAEREFLRLLHGDCNCPVGVLATIDGNNMRLRGQLFSDQSTEPRQGEVAGKSGESERLAARLLHRLQS
jgi:hydroxymethylbilane synthase